MLKRVGNMLTSRTKLKRISFALNMVAMSVYTDRIALKAWNERVLNYFNLNFFFFNYFKLSARLSLANIKICLQTLLSSMHL